MSHFPPEQRGLSHYRLRGVDLWNAEGVTRRVSLTITNGILQRIDPDEKREPRSGFVVLPSGVDTQVHLRVPGQSEKETAETGLRAALAGGIGALLTMPNTRPVLDSPEVLLKARKEVSATAERLGIAVLWSAAATLGQKGEALSPLEGLATSGAIAFTDDGRAVDDDGLLDELFGRLAPLGLPFFQHAERRTNRGRLSPSSIQEALAVAPYPELEETAVVERDLVILSRHPQTRYHLLHVSTPESVRLIAGARKRGLRVTCEVSPHHLWFCDEEIDAGSTSFCMNPPLRSRLAREALRLQLANGDIDWVATDHAPHEPAAKGTDFAKVAFGTIGLETSLRVLLALLADGVITPPRLVEVFSLKPAQFLMLPEHGRLSPGAAFRAVVVAAPSERVQVRSTEFHSRSKNSCFIGTALPPGPVLHATSSGLFGDHSVAQGSGLLEVLLQ